MSFCYIPTQFFFLAVFIAQFLNAADKNCDKVRASGSGTVLFGPTDVYKICWSQEEIAILTARMILEDIVPDPKMISVQCNDDVEDLVKYFKVLSVKYLIGQTTITTFRLISRALSTPSDRIRKLANATLCCWL